LDDSHSSILVGISFSIRKDQKLSLDSLSIEGTEVFRKNARTRLFDLATQQPGNAMRYEVMPRDMLRNLKETVSRIFSLPRILAQRILYVPSRRNATGGAHSHLKLDCHV
jgi:hypothetical protein